MWQVFVHSDKRIQALVLITILALQLYSLIEWEAKKADQNWKMGALKEFFSGVAILQTLNDDGSIDME
jgi:transposase